MKIKQIIILIFISVLSPDIVGAQSYMSKVFPTESLNVPRDMIYNGEYIYVPTANIIGDGYGTTIRLIDDNLDVTKKIDFTGLTLTDESFYSDDFNFYLYGTNNVDTEWNTFMRLNNNLEELDRINYSTCASYNFAKSSVLVGDKMYTVTQDIRELYEDEILWFNKIDLEGNQLWTKKYGTAYKRNFASEMLRSNDDQVLVSMSHVEGAEVIGEVLKMDEDGNEVWKYTQNEPIAETGLGIQDQWIHTLETGETIIASTTDRNGDPVFSFNQWYKYPQKLTWIDQNGEFLKDTLILSPRYEEIHIGQLRNSKGGGFYGFGYWGSTSNGGWNGWIFKMTNDGEMLWSRKYKHEGLEIGKSHSISDLIELDNGDIVTVGSIGGPGVQGLWMMKLNSDGCLSDGDCGIEVIATSTVEVLEKVSDLSMMYPNPSNGIFNIDQGILHQIKSLELYSTQGAKLQVWSSQIPSSIDLSSYKSGVYLLKAQLGNGDMKTYHLSLVR